MPRTLSFRVGLLLLISVKPYHSLSSRISLDRHGNRLALFSRFSTEESDLNDTNNLATKSRRAAFVQIMTQIFGISTAFAVRIDPAAATTVNTQEEVDKSKLYNGYLRLNFLLDNWVAETTVCGMSDNPYISSGGCERTPLKVMDYLGYRNINDPLFRADKTMRRLENLVPSDREVEYLEAIEKWQEAAEEGNGMAYISSWGEANPGGGKDRVNLFIARAKKNVIDSRDSLATVIDILGIQKPP